MSDPFTEAQLKRRKYVDAHIAQLLIDLVPVTGDYDYAQRVVKADSDALRRDIRDYIQRRFVERNICTEKEFYPIEMHGEPGNTLVLNGEPDGVLILGNKKIILNSIQCNFCKDVIISFHKHDFKFCKCKNVSIDGGLDYLKRGFHKQDDYRELSQFE